MLEPPKPPEPEQPPQLTPLEEAHAARGSSGFGARFAFIYGGLAAILVASVVGLVLVARQPGPPKQPPWSTWKPKTSSTANMTQQITDHVAAQYKLSSSGDQLLAIIPSKPEITRNTKVSDVSTIAIRTSASSQNFSRIIATKGNMQLQLCGLGSECSIERGTATAARERLTRREALEIALYTFKYVPSVNALIAYMPPPPGQTPQTLLYLERANLSDQLKQPLSRTLPLMKPPLPSQPDTKESTTIDRLTLPVEYSFGYQPLSNGTDALILTPTSY
jgi:hypothetical protein